jgi:hypothetical protein
VETVSKDFLSVSGSAEVQVQVAGEKAMVKFLIVDRAATEVLLGTDALASMGLCCDFAHLQLKGRAGGTAEIRLGSSKPTSQARRVETEEGGSRQPRKDNLAEESHEKESSPSQGIASAQESPSDDPIFPARNEILQDDIQEDSEATQLSEGQRKELATLLEGYRSQCVVKLQRRGGQGLPSNRHRRKPSDQDPNGPAKSGNEERDPQSRPGDATIGSHPTIEIPVELKDATREQEGWHEAPLH